MFDIDYEHYIQEASGHYFTDHLPDEWNEWEREELDEWCEEHAWEPFEYHPTDWVFEQVTTLARTIHRLVEKATKALEHSVAECEQEIHNLRTSYLGARLEMEKLNIMYDEVSQGEG